MHHVTARTLALSLLLTSCAVTAKNPVPTVSYIDLPRFMGNWYVIASIPTIAEKHAVNAVESYRLEPEGTVATTFTFRKESAQGPVRTMHARGWVQDGTNAVWGMQFVWPIKAEYRIAYVDDEYTETIIARTARDYVWIMARSPTLAPREFERLVSAVELLGYDSAKLRRVPQSWP